ncbi:MAG: hypothetical protein VX527_01865 [Planctomycetota bacterium]|nr:hypothetical protein [Planctomycetota bacterium]
MAIIQRIVGTVLVISVLGLLPGCDEYEREQLRQAGDDIDSASEHVGDASSSALDRARHGTGKALQNLGDKIDDHNQQIDDAADPNSMD